MTSGTLTGVSRAGDASVAEAAPFNALSEDGVDDECAFVCESGICESVACDGESAVALLSPVAASAIWAEEAAVSLLVGDDGFVAVVELEKRVVFDGDVTVIVTGEVAPDVEGVEAAVSVRGAAGSSEPAFPVLPEDCGEGMVATLVEAFPTTSDALGVVPVESADFVGASEVCAEVLAGTVVSAIVLMGAGVGETFAASAIAEMLTGCAGCASTGGIVGCVIDGEERSAGECEVTVASAPCVVE